MKNHLTGGRNPYANPSFTAMTEYGREEDVEQIPRAFGSMAATGLPKEL
jgi:hypothetical protein